MDKIKFQSLVRECINEYSSPKETITKTELKTVIKETIRTILNEMANKAEEEEILDEMTTTSAVGPISLPGNVRGGWVSGRGGSHRGVAGSAALGYELTSIGKKDMKRKQDPV
jgi:hypothetical protein